MAVFMWMAATEQRQCEQLIVVKLGGHSLKPKKRMGSRFADSKTRTGHKEGSKLPPKQFGRVRWLVSSKKHGSLGTYLVAQSPQQT